MTEETMHHATIPIVKSYQVENYNKIWTLTEQTQLVIHDTEKNRNNERLLEISELVSHELNSLENVLLEPIFLAKDDMNDGDIFIELGTNKDIGVETESDELYKITIDSHGVHIIGVSENAILHAFHTLHQSLKSNDGLAYGSTVDYPQLKERRLHVDIARKYISKDWLIQHIRELSYFKINTLQLHFSENKGFRIESDFDPTIVSEEHLTKDEIREVLEEARLYGIQVIPSLDTPGHVEHILKFYPEFGQIAVDGTKSKVALDVTNQKAIQYMRGLYSEYMDLFSDCTDFHIGGDEYMEFDRPPFTTKYQPVLDEYAKEHFGKEYQWNDVISDYINDLAEFVYKRGFKPRIWNDGIYYDDERNPQKVTMHKYIGIDFWCQMGWIEPIAVLQTFIDQGHKDIYNVNSNFFYYVLRDDVPEDGRPQHSFDRWDQDYEIYENWTPGIFSDNVIDDDHPNIKGAAMAIWCDNPNLVDEDVITDDIRSELRAFASKAWNPSSNQTLSFDKFKHLQDLIGHAPYFD